MIKTMHVKNFKGLTDLNVSNMSNITLFGGKNNVGKTTLLEALFMFLDRLNANMIIRQLNWRGINEISLTADSIFYPIFNNFNINNTIEISVINEKSIKESMYIRLKDQLRNSIIQANIQNNSIGAINTNQEPLPTVTLEINYQKSTDKNEEKVNLFLNKQGLGINTQNGKRHNFTAAFQSVHDLVESYNFIAPDHSCSFKNGDIKVGIYIMPGGSENGMLEDLCLQTQKNNPVMNCVESFFDKLSKTPVDQPRNMSKAKSQVFLAGMPKIVNSVGLGAITLSNLYTIYCTIYS